MGYGNKSINDWRDEVTNVARSKGFRIENSAESIALMHSELSEALEDIRDGRAESEIWYETKDKQKVLYSIGEDSIPNKPCGVPSEMADVIIRVLHFCGHYGIDIEQAIREKSYYNEHRHQKHGKKF